MVPEFKLLMAVAVAAALLLRCLYLEKVRVREQGRIASLRKKLVKQKSDADYYSDEYIFISSSLLRLSFMINDLQAPTYEGSDNEMKAMDVVSFFYKRKEMRGVLCLNILSDGLVDVAEPFIIQAEKVGKVLHFGDVSQIRLEERNDNKFLDMVEEFERAGGRSVPREPQDE